MLCLLLVTVIYLAPAAAGEVAYFRADSGVGQEVQRPLPEDFDAPQALLWKQPLDAGHSTPCIVGDRVFVTTFDGKELATVALDAGTGKQLWRRVCPNTRLEPFHKTGSPAASSPASDGQRVYVFFGSYGLLAYDLQGELAWSVPMGPFQDEFGSASSPILAGGKLILNEDHDIDSFLLALDPATGKPIWRTRRDDFTRSYATPIVWRGAGRDELVVAGALQLAAYDLDDGRVLWKLPGLARIVNTTPTQHGNRLVVATWSPGGDTDARIGMDTWPAAVEQWDKDKNGKLTREEVNNPDVLDRFFRIDLNQDQGLDEAEWTKYARVFDLAQNSLQVFDAPGVGEAAPRVAWEYRKGVPYVPSPVVVGNVVFMVKEGGIVSSLDLASGKLLKQARARGTGSYFASPVAGDGKLYLISDAGVLTVITAEGSWSVLASHDFGERTVATPVIHGGSVYIRTEKALYRFAKP